MKKPWTPLTLIQVAWVVEVIAIACQTIVAWWVSLVVYQDMIFFGAWVSSVSVLAALIAAQGAAASIGPLVSDKIKAGITNGISALNGMADKKGE